MKLYRLSGLMLRWNFPLMNPCCAVMFSFTSCHHFTNSVSFPLGTEKTLINVTAIVNPLFSLGICRIFDPRTG